VRVSEILIGGGDVRVSEILVWKMVMWGCQRYSFGRWWYEGNRDTCLESG